MIFRFLMFWVFISLAVGVWKYLAAPEEKKAVKSFAKATFFSMLVGAVLITVLMFVNNLQGI